MNRFRNLTADEIDVRVATCSDKGCSLLLYKDARVDQNILDETFGIYGWERSHQVIGDRLYCTVKIKNEETGEWISKQDVGTESYTEKEKGQASDSFKRACFNLGIGRELYSAPFIWVGADMVNLKQNGSGKVTTYDSFRVKEIGYRDGIISNLIIVNNSKKGMVVYNYKKMQNAQPADQSVGEKKQGDGVFAVDQNQAIHSKQVLTLKMMAKKHNMPEQEIYGRYGKKSMEEITIKDWVDFGKNGQEILNKWDKEHMQN